MRRTLIVLVVLAVLGAAGGAVALSAPTLFAGAARETPAPKLPAAPRVLGPLAKGPAPQAAAVASRLDPAAEAMPGRFTGVVMDPASGATLWEHDAQRQLTPGSTGKVVTAAAALLTLNPTETFVTRVLAGPDDGTVVLVGGGDPTLTAQPENKKTFYPDPARLTKLAEEVKKAAKGPIERLLVDTSRFTGPEMAEGWLTADIAAGYVTPMEALMLDGGRIDPTQGDTPRVAKPAEVASQAFAKLLGVTDISEGAATPDARELGSVSSAPFADLVEHALRSSDNILAESLAREVAVERGGEASFAGAAAQSLAALAQAGFDPSGAEMHDGSGLSTLDKIPAKLLGALVAAAAAPQKEHETQFLRPLLTGLPVAGGDGTLDARFGRDSDAASGRGVVRAKTGTLTGVTSLAGVVMDADGTLLVFALMSNGASPATARPLLDDMAAALSRCGCT
ncbi:D-alanyl-D-alanine carboxypeptidase/D-alanyl-D-alanine endopeptidase [Pseudonocardia sp. TRM90224]|uniref:D-alanyl-D-alanine carboxypeptidase/D-alanyl-D-alanine endopeptidase n=1 Tax=Pseudonocardia sp. TRM90224 TaxID=2812678 RepID=UPI001E5D7391|nr:D-alanyl-D-alanine carboxypeptidase/D-alanyl-D-alanine-endopeptidase [Pseudonocardia sp. TRM90224]